MYQALDARETVKETVAAIAQDVEEEVIYNVLSRVADSYDIILEFGRRDWPFSQCGRYVDL